MLERFLEQVNFTSQQDFIENLKIKVPENFNFGYDVMDVWAAEHPDKKALLWTNDRGEEKQFTFAELKTYSDQTASYFQQLGIGPGDKVMLILKRRYEFWFSMLALHKLGAIAIPATYLLTKYDVIYRCNTAPVKMIVCTGEETILDHIREALPDSPSVKKCVSIGPIVPPGFDDYQAGIRQAKPFIRPKYPNRNEDTSLIYFTSGTTGEPKMVAHDFTYPLGHIVTGSYWHQLEENSLHLTLADTGWGKAAWGKLYGQWLAGANVFIYDHEKFSPAALLKQLSRYRVTSFCAPPTVFRFLIRENLDKYDLSALRHCSIAGEALNPILSEEFEKHTGIPLMEAYGQTETTLVIGTFPWTKPKAGSMGVPNPQYDLELLTPQGKPARPGEEGEIVIRTQYGKPLGLFKGYEGNPEYTRKVWHDGLYHTGDLARRDEEGYFWFIGRTDDIIKSSGYRIGPFEVESALTSHPAVMECAVTGVPDEIRGQIVKATVVLTPQYKARQSNELARELQTYVKTRTAPYKYPRLIEFVDSLPKTYNGKIRHIKIRENSTVQK